MSILLSKIGSSPEQVSTTGLVDLMKSCIEGGASIGFMLPVDQEELKAYWEKVLAEASKGVRLILVARSLDGTLLGSAQLALETRKNGRHRAEVQKLMVSPEARNAGLGAQLMAALETEARERGVTLLFLDTSEGPAGAGRFYERLGYSYAGGIPGYALDPHGPASKNAIYYKTLDAKYQATSSKKDSPRIVTQAMEERHWEDVKTIYQEGIDTGHSTFQSTAPATWREFIAGKVEGCSLVAVDETDHVLGWAVLSPISGRCVYAGVSEVSVYIAKRARGQGVGKSLLAALIIAAESRGIWTLQSGTFPENAASIALQLRHGFRVVGTRERMGLMSHGPWAGRWRDVLMLERRSRSIGTS